MMPVYRGTLTVRSVEERFRTVHVSGFGEDAVTASPATN